MLLNCLAYMCRTLNPLDKLHKSGYYILNSANPYTFKHLNNGGSIQITTLTPSVIFFKGGTNASKPVSSFTTKTMRNTRYSSTAPPPPPPPRKTNEMLSYPHKITWRILTNVCYGSFTGSKILETYILRQFTYSLETVHRQTVI